MTLMALSLGCVDAEPHVCLVDGMTNTQLFPHAESVPEPKQSPPLLPAVDPIATSSFLDAFTRGITSLSISSGASASQRDRSRRLHPRGVSHSALHVAPETGFDFIVA
jgi:hypothetical protein